MAQTKKIEQIHPA